jgi:ATP-dependent exoDNAse (exonuclease V) alpha subunit
MESKTLNTSTKPSLLDLDIQVPEALLDSSIPLVMVTGKPGTGKSTLINYILEKHPGWGIKTSTTGISACNINGVTIHSLLGVFNTDSWILANRTGRIKTALSKIREFYSTIVVDEIFMLGKIAFSILVFNVLTWNRENPDKQIRLVMTGDAGQLPPVKDDPIFMAGSWANVHQIKLTKVHRQSDIDFLSALDHLRNGEPRKAVDYFQEKIGFCDRISRTHQGIILEAKNDAVDRENWTRLQGISSPERKYINYVAFNKFNEDEEKLLKKFKTPKELALKEGAPVMCLINNRHDGYANGDLGTVIEMAGEGVFVRLLRNNTTVFVTQATQEDAKGNKVIYMPLRLAWVSTYHKMQSMTTDAIQLVLSPEMTSRTHGMAYTGITRVRTPDGLRIVCKGPDEFIKCFYTNKEWLAYM